MSLLCLILIVVIGRWLLKSWPVRIFAKMVGFVILVGLFVVMLMPVWVAIYC